MSVEVVDEQGGLRISGRAVHDRGMLRVETQVSNTGAAPLEAVTVRLAVDSAEFHVQADAKLSVHHLLPGDAHEHAFVLEPRRSVEQAPLALRGKAEVNGGTVRCDVDLGPVDFKLRGRRKQVSDEGIPRM